MTARWMSVDPVWLELYSQQYGYCQNHGLEFIDPSGLRCQVCSTAAFYRDKIVVLDALATGQEFSSLAKSALSGIILRSLANAFNAPNSFDHAGPYFLTNKGEFKDGEGTVYKAKGAKWFGYLFFVTFNVCEDNDGDCALHLDETGTNMIISRPGKADETNNDNSINHGDITAGSDVAIAEIAKPVANADGARCSKMIIYRDMPQGIAIMQGNGKVWLKQIVKQTLEIKDTSSDDKVVAKFTHTVIIGVGARREEIASP